MVAATLLRSAVRGLMLGLLIAESCASTMGAEAQDAATFVKQGQTWCDTGDYSKAIAAYDQAIKLDPKNVQAYNNRGIVWREKKEFARAVADFDQAIKLNPKYAVAYNNRGNTWLRKKEYQRAFDDFEQAIKLDPKFAHAYNDLAWLQATCPDRQYRNGQKAFENAKRAYELSENMSADLRAEIMETLAAAYVETDDFEQAREWQARSIEVWTYEGNKYNYRPRLELYEQEKRYDNESDQPTTEEGG